MALGGALGALSRWGISEAAKRILGDTFPYGTLIANVLGCLVMGFVMQWSLAHPALPRAARLALTVGLLGALTTFSTFSFETVEAFQSGRTTVAVLNIATNLVVSVAACVAGIALAKLL